MFYSLELKPMGKYTSQAIDLKLSILLRKCTLNNRSTHNYFVILFIKCLHFIVECMNFRTECVNVIIGG